jgi:8-oxo-dGTP pyrophosphatase MutT (NUDIX family)
MNDLLWPVSIKGVVTADRHVLLMLNERDQWELPGGRLEVGESPVQCVEREIREETGLAVAAGRIVDSWVYPVVPEQHVVIVTYRCTNFDEIPAVAISDEHHAARWVHVDDCPNHPMPTGYLSSIQACS